MQFYFLLVEPETAENVGAAARAIHTMGFAGLRLVNSDAHRSHRAWFMAHGCPQILESAGSFLTLKEAVADIDFVIGTVPGQRNIYRPHCGIRDLNDHLQRMQGTLSSVAVVFGRESIGLNNDELMLCDLLCTIPMAQKFPEINLAQSVMVFAYELSQAIWQRPAKKTEFPVQDYKMVKDKIQGLLEACGINEDKRAYQQIQGKVSQLSQDSLGLVHYICNVLKRSLENR